MSRVVYKGGVDFQQTRGFEKKGYFQAEAGANKAPAVAF